jgi:hypothetical protein
VVVVQSNKDALLKKKKCHVTWVCVFTFHVLSLSLPTISLNFIPLRPPLATCLGTLTEAGDDEGGACLRCWRKRTGPQHEKWWRGSR